MNTRFNQGHFTFKGIRDLLSFTPAIFILSYLFGFMIVGSFLRSLQVVDNDLFSLNYVIAGSVFLFLLSPALVIVYSFYDKPSDNIGTTWKYSIDVLLNVLEYLVYLHFLLYLLNYPNKSQVQGVSQYADYLIIYGLLLMINNSKAIYLSSVFARRLTQDLFWIIKLLPIIFYAAIVITDDVVNLNLFLVIIVISVSFFIILGERGDKNLSPVKITFFIFATLWQAHWYGTSVYATLPNVLGGARPKTVQILSVKDTNLFFSSDTLKGQYITLLYVTSDKYILRKDSTVYSVRKELISGFIY